MTRILLIDDDTELTHLLKTYLEHEGLSVDAVPSTEEAEIQVQSNTYDLWVLDIMMPGRSGLEFLQSVRPRNQTPIILLTGRGEEIDRILGLEMGADDYLPKPANPRELLARIRAVVRRTDRVDSHAKSSTLQLGVLEWSARAREANFDGVRLELTDAEFTLLGLLIQHAGAVLTRDWLTQQVLHRPLTAYDRAIDVHLSRVRAKLKVLDDSFAARIKTVRGQGYQLALQQGEQVALV